MTINLFGKVYMRSFMHACILMLGGQKGLKYNYH